MTDPHEQFQASSWCTVAAVGAYGDHFGRVPDAATALAWYVGSPNYADEFAAWADDQRDAHLIDLADAARDEAGR